MPPRQRFRIGNADGRLIVQYYQQHGVLWDIIINGINVQKIPTRAVATQAYRPSKKIMVVVMLCVGEFVTTFSVK